MRSYNSMFFHLLFFFCAMSIIFGYIACNTNQSSISYMNFDEGILRDFLTCGLFIPWELYLIQHKANNYRKYNFAIQYQFVSKYLRALIGTFMLEGLEIAGLFVAASYGSYLMQYKQFYPVDIVYLVCKIITIWWVLVILSALIFIILLKSNNLLSAFSFVVVGTLVPMALEMIVKKNYIVTFSDIFANQLIRSGSGISLLRMSALIIDILFIVYIEYVIMRKILKTSGFYLNRKDEE